MLDQEWLAPSSLHLDGSVSVDTDGHQSGGKSCQPAMMGGHSGGTLC